MDNEKFIIRTRQWLNHKFQLALHSEWYKQPRQKAAVANVKDRFSAFLMYPNNFSVHHLAVLIKRHEDLLLTLMPIPKNPSYEQAFNSLAQIMEYANTIINNNQLRQMV